MGLVAVLAVVAVDGLVNVPGLRGNGGDGTVFGDLIWSSKSTDAAFTRGAVKVRLRPRVTRHGGATKTAVG